MNHFILIILALSAAFSLLQTEAAHAGTKPDVERLMLLPDDRIVAGTVQDIRTGFIQVNIGGVDPLFCRFKPRVKKGMASLKPGDKLMIVVSDENELIDFHLADQPRLGPRVEGAPSPTSGRRSVVGRNSHGTG
jgi:hypothetical protein